MASIILPGPPRDDQFLSNEAGLEDDQDLRPSVFHHEQLVVNNQGSVTRDFLAFERNWLSWIKLVISCMVISGALLIRLQVNEAGRDGPHQPLEIKAAIPLGSIFFALSILSLLAATSSFFRVQSGMLKGLGHVTNGWFTELISMLVTVVVAASCILLVVATCRST